MNDIKRFFKVLMAQNLDSLSQMAHKLEISCSYLSRIETGSRRLTTKIIQKITKKYNLSTDDEQFLYDCLTEDTNQIVIPVDNIEETHRKLLISICGELRKTDVNKLIEIRGMMNE